MDICQIATKVISGEQALAAFRVYRTERIFILCDSFLTQSGLADPADCPDESGAGF